MLQYRRIYDYIVTDEGHLYSLKRPDQIHPTFGAVKRIATKPNKNGYISCAISKNDGTKRIMMPLHRFILMTFNPRHSYKNMDAHHIDGNKSNNCLHNLKWLTHNANCSLRVFKEGHGKWRLGAKTSNETKLKQSLAKQGEKHIRFMGHYCKGDNKYPSLRIAAKSEGISIVSIMKYSKSNMLGWSFEPVS